MTIILLKTQEYQLEDLDLEQNFGIRGIKLIVDGVPETTPDGQSQIDNLNLEIIEKIEIIKGTSSSLYGNSSAGVIKIQSISEFDKNFYKNWICIRF